MITVNANGRDLDLSRDGSLLAFVSVTGDVGYSISLRRTSDIAILGALPTGAYPQEIAFSPDGRIAYTVHTGGQISIWDTTTFLQVGTISSPSQTAFSELWVERTGRYLFAARGNETHVFNTGMQLNVGDTNSNALLDLGETWQFRATIPGELGQHQLGVTAHANSPWGETLTATSTTHYYSLVPGLTIQYAINGQPADALPGVEILVGRSIEWTATMTNGSAAPISQFQVIDNLGRTMAPQIKPGLPAGATTNLGDTNANDQLDPGETWHFESTSADVAGPGARRHSATVVNAQGLQIAARDFAYYLGVYDLEVIRSVGDQYLTPLSLPPNVPVVVSDSRFEIVNSQLRAKSGTFLNLTFDQGREIFVRAQADGQVLHKLVLHVLSNSFAWHNATLPTDVDGDGLVLSRDAAQIITELNALGAHKLVAAVNYGAGRLAFDVNRDGELTPLDALLTIIHLNAGGPEVGSGEGEGETLAPATNLAAPTVASAPISAASLVAWRAATEPLPDADSLPANARLEAPSLTISTAPQVSQEILDPHAALAVTSLWTDAAYASSEHDELAVLFDAIVDDLAAASTP